MLISDRFLAYFDECHFRTTLDLDLEMRSEAAQAVDRRVVPGLSFEGHGP
jgi:hypothetical protein